MLGMFGFGSKKKKCQAIIIYPTKKVVMVNVEMESTRFTVGKKDKAKSYMIQDDAIYYFNDKPLLFYDSEDASPIKISSNEIITSMNSTEFQSVIESKVVKDLMVASTGFEWDVTLIASVISAIGVLLLVVQGGGFNFLGGA